MAMGWVTSPSAQSAWVKASAAVEVEEAESQRCSPASREQVQS